KALEINGKLGRLDGMAIQYGNLGLIYRTRGDPDRAEAMYRKALEVHERLGRLEGMAAQYGNLGLIYRTRGDRVRA
ncbi:MAG: tetratricopeptide repeat protein, partial [Planctomycetota bacterium]